MTATPAADRAMVTVCERRMRVARRADRSRYAITLQGTSAMKWELYLGLPLVVVGFVAVFRLLFNMD
ncbi:MAG: hypothetical protein KF735_08460 [Chelatococcus sp.]|uniref:hypothetical protein n=1 Tax=Chelatococcus sp. TaxID=1953771 RepID=UPI0025C26956|nr:hypothetical protein [Chelatococcus sp.]MBX3537655.1 hypothetical protein [Chelatococcus sp.]